MISSLFLRLFAGSLTVGYVGATKTYQLDTSYSGSTFFEGWDFFNGPDPTNGFVTYNDANSASAKDLISVDSAGTAFLYVDDKTVLDTKGPGRDSVRISTKKQFSEGLIIADITNMPGGVCGTWPAFWTVGPDWPASGEIDIIEGINSQSKNQMSLHTSGECSITSNLQTATLQNSNCDENHGYGCGAQDKSALSYGKAFNSNKGGVYATQWTEDFIRIWFFPAGSVPADIHSGNPDPKTWGTPTSDYQGKCEIKERFKNHNIILDTTFCGGWGGGAWAADPVCGKLAKTCDEYVAKNPTAFSEMYWAIKSVKVYQLGEAPVSQSSTQKPVPTTTPEPISTSKGGVFIEHPSSTSSAHLSTATSSSTPLSENQPSSTPNSSPTSTITPPYPTSTLHPNNSTSSSVLPTFKPTLTPYPSQTISTIVSTKIYTITSCAPTITNCPAHLGSLTTEIITSYTTFCPGTESSYPTSTPIDSYGNSIVTINGGTKMGIVTMVHVPIPTGGGNGGGNGNGNGNGTSVGGGVRPTGVPVGPIVSQIPVFSGAEKRGTGIAGLGMVVVFVGILGGLGSF